MLSFLQFLWHCFRRMLNRLQRTQAERGVQYFMIFNQDVYFSHDQSLHRPHNGDVLNYDHSFYSSLMNNGNWTSNVVTNTSNENASTVITNGDSAGGFNQSSDIDDAFSESTSERSCAE
ncbi:hypothetical protein CPC08DRAFT_713298 [Agrocybe pediades]|nr:hypothetical protein CPC08DRAFT_713298 [Agrocybe pediades]